MVRTGACVAWVLVVGLAVSAAEKPDILTTAASTGKFQTLVNLVVATGLDKTLQSEGPFTVFAPTDEAFARLPEGTVAALLKPENREQLVTILKYHVVPGKPAAGTFTNGKGLQTAAGIELQTSLEGHNERFVNKIRVARTDVRCSNGVICPIDGVLLPSAKPQKTILAIAEEAGNFKTLVKALKATGLDAVLDSEGSYTVFAPTDAAFSKLPKGFVAKLLSPAGKDDLGKLLKSHVVSGAATAKQLVNPGFTTALSGKGITIAIVDGRLTVQDEKVLKTDLKASNGVIHVIDGVLIP